MAFTAVLGSRRSLGFDVLCFASGEEKFSYGYGGTSKFSTNLKFQDFGKKFSEGDVVGAYAVSDVGGSGEIETDSYQLIYSSRE